MTMRRKVRFSAGIVVLCGSALLSACGTATIEDAMPQGALSAQSAAPRHQAAGPPASGLSTQGEYPNLNIPTTPAAPQFTEAERDAAMAELRATRDRQAAQARPGGTGAGEAAELRRLARNHAQAALRAIEGE